MARKLPNLSNRGFSLPLTLIIIVVVSALSFSGWLVYKNNHKKISTPSSSAAKTDSTPTDPYAGWNTYCDADNAMACFKYPGDWQPSKYGGFEDSSQTAYINYQGHNNKDQASADVYIAQVIDLLDTSYGLKIVGSIYNNVPSYAIFNSSDVSSLKMGSTVPFIVANPEFVGAGESMSFTATPGSAGTKAITSLEQAKTWFNTTEAQQCLKVLQSFYYHQ